MHLHVPCPGQRPLAPLRNHPRARPGAHHSGQLDRRLPRHPAPVHQRFAQLPRHRRPAVRRLVLRSVPSDHLVAHPKLPGVEKVRRLSGHQEGELCQHGQGKRPDAELRRAAAAHCAVRVPHGARDQGGTAGRAAGPFGRELVQFVVGGSTFFFFFL
uniref:(northern house mosquito) hypothetical protein n=1 Tax=Culex pipiens TaxID=7175 RepID=A0A8D8MES5_CULPI